MPDISFYSDSETQPNTARQAQLFSRLPSLLSEAIAAAPFYAEHLKGVDPESITDRSALEALPILRKSDVSKTQTAAPPFGGLTGTAAGRFELLFSSPGPIYEPAGAGDWWRMGQSLHAAGFRAGDIALNCFSYHLTPAGFMMERAARAVGCAVIPGGVGNTALQGDMIAHYRATGYVGTPDFLKLILEAADEAGLDTSSVERALVSGGPLFSELRNWYQERGISTFQAYGTADCGLIAFESAAKEGMICAEDIIVELIDPNTGQPTEKDEVGEVVITTLDAKFPLLRYALGDLSAWMTGTSPCGRTAPRIKGWMGRIDLTTKIRGMFVHPTQIEAALVPFSKEIERASLVVDWQDGHDRPSLQVAMQDGQEFSAIREALESKLQSTCRLRIPAVDAPSLAAEAKLIDDQRKL